MTTVYSQDSCPGCRGTERHLERLGVPFTVVNVTQDAAAGEFVRSLGARSTPVVVLESGVWWDGHRPDRLDELAA